MSKLYWAGCALVGFGCGFMYAAGRVDAAREAKQREHDTWAKANTDHSEMGSVDNVRVQSDRSDIAGNPA